MADDLHYLPGDFYRICERTGFKVRAGRTKKEWTGRYIRDKSWEERHPQDFVRGVPDPQVAPEPRPRQTDQFLGPLQTTISAAATAGATSLHVVSSTRMQIGDKLEIMLDTGSYAVITVGGLPSATQITLSLPLPYSVSVGNIITDTTQVAQPSIG